MPPLPWLTLSSGLGNPTAGPVQGGYFQLILGKLLGIIPTPSFTVMI